jgi:hypothetical protein
MLILQFIVIVIFANITDDGNFDFSKFVKVPIPEDIL